MAPASAVKLFMALTAESPAFDDYATMAKVAVTTARRHTTLQPHFIYDGEDNAFTAWLGRHDVPVWRHRSRFYDDIRAVALAAGRPKWVGVGAGAFLRVDLPRLARAQGIHDEFALYTDCDVMFRHDVATTLRALRPPHFAVAPQFVQEDPDDINTGVMWMNLAQLAADDTGFGQFIAGHLGEFAGVDWDQSAFRRYYGRPRHDASQWDRLPAELNWKPYWGDNRDAQVVHFHGPKPTQRLRLRQGEGPDLLRTLATAAFDSYCDEWEEVLAEAR